MECDSNRERQDNEKAALRAIYGDQLVELSSDSAGSWTPLECILVLGPEGTITPQPNSPIVHLHIICTDEYPLCPPTIELQHWKGISNEKIKMIKNELDSLAKELKGEEMIFNLASHIEKYLVECIQPDYESFYEEMIVRHKTLAEKERQQKIEDDEKKKKEQKLAILEKQQAVKKALRKRQNSVKSLEDLESKSPHSNEKIVGLETDCAKHDQDLDVNKNKSDYSPWNLSGKGHSRYENEFEHIKWLGKGAFGDVMKVRNKLDDGLYAIKRIELNPSEKNLNKKITREVKLLSRLNHENVVRYYNSWIESAEIRSLSTQCSIKSKTGKNVNEEALEMLPINNNSFSWNIDIESANSDDSSSDYIMFRSSSNEKCDQKEDSVIEHSDTSTLKSSPLLYMYIQMELCDKSTLRQAIDDNLYLDSARVWRLFREIIEGLCHIHQQGIIHRDLKPVNIFIGNDDHVKIGDFGLATTIILQKQTVPRENPATLDSTDKTDSSSLPVDSNTGQVGTALYIAPELNQLMAKSYNQKVDIYSLGVIFYEMSHPPMKTLMERYKVLLELRKYEAVFSKEFPHDEKSPQHLLIRWMLQHDVDKRPTSQELLQSSYIPQQKLEDKELADMIRRILSNPQNKNYNHLISSCFNQPIQASLNATYNISSWRSTGFISSLEIVSNKLRNIFHCHGALSFLPPLLTPAGQVSDSAVCLMTRFGCIVNATYDLQMPFARYLAHGPNISQFKRYAIDKVFKERPAGVHPKENYECAFDIVTPNTGELLPEYEILCVIWEILNEFPSILNRNCSIYLNHANLLSAMIKHTGLEDEKYKVQLGNIFSRKSICNNKQDLETYLKGIGINERSLTSLVQWMEIQGSLNKVTSLILAIVKEDSLISLCKNGLRQLEIIIQFCELIGISCPVLINLSLTRNGHCYSGLMIQVQASQKLQMKQQSEQTVLIHGGRYDNLIQQLKEGLSREDGRINHFVIGFTLSIEKFLFTIENREKPSSIDVLVCAMGKLNLSHEKLFFLRDLWKSGVKASFINTMEPLEELQTRCRDMGIPTIVVIKDAESGFSRIRTLVKDRYTEKKVPYSELLEYLIRNKVSVTSESVSFKGELKSQISSEGPAITFITLDKLNPNIKRRYESQILNNLVSVLQKFSAKVKVEVLATNVDSEILKAITYHMDLAKNDPDLSPVMKKYPKHKKIIQKVILHIKEAKISGQSCIYIVYSIPDNLYKVLL